MGLKQYIMETKKASELNGECNLGLLGINRISQKIYKEKRGIYLKAIDIAFQVFVLQILIY